ncbi:MAG TPA: hypothetical protein VFT39_19585, partial [Vicinamibacterales bacterium]|nr:hypothetical protein [Vicinamibacterales bacterium]
VAASTIPSEDLSRILKDYLALDRVRIYRRLLLARVGLLAVLAALLETSLRGSSPLVRLFTVALCLFPPAWARIVEFAHERRLSRRIEALDGRVTHKFEPRSARGQTPA